MSEMAERVARAYEPELWTQIDAHLGGCDKPETAHWAREASLHRARAAIAAMHTELSMTECRHPKCAVCGADIEKEIAALREEVEDYDRSFDLRWKADMRAIKRWQAAGEGRELTWPDHADLCVWLLEQLDAMRAGDKRDALRD